MMMMVCSFRFIRRAALLALLGKKVVERQSSRISICKKRTFRINNTLNIWTKKGPFWFNFVRARQNRRHYYSSRFRVFSFVFGGAFRRFWRSRVREREREGERDRASSSRLHTHHRHRRRAKGFTTKEKHSKAFSFVFPEKRDVKERRISQQKSHIIMRDFAARASTSFAEGACCVTFFPSREVRSARRDRPTMTTTFVVYVQNHNNNNNNNGHKNESGIPLGKKRGAKFPPIFCLGCFLYPLFFFFPKRTTTNTNTTNLFFSRERRTNRRPRNDVRGTNEPRTKREDDDDDKRRDLFPCFSFFFPKKTSRRSSTSLVFFVERYILILLLLLRLSRRQISTRSCANGGQ